MIDVNRRVLPGFGLSLGYTMLYLSFMIAVPMAAGFWKASSLSFDDFTYAWSIDERSNLTPWQPIIWPLRGVVPLTALLLFLQGISEFLKALWAARTGELLVQHEKIEL